MKPHVSPLLQALAPEHPDNARPCRTPTARPRPSKAVAETELAKMQRAYAQTAKSIQQLEAYLATL